MINLAFLFFNLDQVLGLGLGLVKLQTNVNFEDSISNWFSFAKLQACTLFKKKKFKKAADNFSVITG